MTDVLTPEQRRRCMASIRGAHTMPEMAVRRMVHAMGFRFRLHQKNLPGRPDLVFAGRGKVIFVHGCFWHLHTCRYGRVTPGTNAEFWSAKREGNRARDRRHLRALRAAGWRVLVVWECEIRNPERLRRRLHRFLSA